MDSPFFAIFIWIVIGSFYGVFFWSLYLAVTLKVETGTKLLYCIGIILIHPFSLLFMIWYYINYRTLKPKKPTAAIQNVSSSATSNARNNLNKIQITCPECGFTRSMEVASMPPKTRTAMCPKCKAKFQVGDLSNADGRSDYSARTEALSQGQALNHQRTNRLESPRHNVKFSSIILAVGFVFSLLWALLCFGMRNLGDGGTTMAIGDMILPMFWPLLVCIIFLTIRGVGARS